MSDSIVNVGNLTKPATVLIERVSDAVGGIAKPWQMKRVAKAQLDIDKMRLLSELELSGIQQRGLQRLAFSEAKKQENIESITAQALPHLNDDSKPEEIEEDWLAYFFAKAEIVSDKEMQSLWANILAAESNSKNRFSKRSIEFVSCLSRHEADIFTRFCSFIWLAPQPESIVFYDIINQNTIEELFKTEDLLNLSSIGLVSMDLFAEYTYSSDEKILKLSYYGEEYSIKSKKISAYNEIRIGNVALTNIGRELFPICGSKPNEIILEETLKKWRSLGYKVSRLIT